MEKKVQLSYFITLVSAASCHSRGMKSSQCQCHHACWRTPNQHFNLMLTVIFLKLTVLLSLSLIVSLSGMQIQLSQLSWLTSVPFQTSPSNIILSYPSSAIEECDPEASRRFSCNPGLSKSTVETRYGLSVCMTKSRTHTSKKLHDLGGDISQQMAVTVRCLLVRPVAFSLWSAGCKGLRTSVVSRKPLAKAKPLWQPHAFRTGEIQTAAEKSFSAYKRWQLLDLLKLPCCCSLYLPPPSSLPTGDFNNCFKALVFQFVYTGM